MWDEVGRKAMKNVPLGAGCSFEANGLSAGVLQFDAESLPWYVSWAVILL